MPKKRYKNKKLMKWLGMIVMLIVSIAIGGYFVSGGFLNVVILNYLPLIVHQVVGWIIIVGSLAKFISDLM